MISYCAERYIAARDVLAVMEGASASESDA
jgi:hypothetical protein